MTTLSSPLTVQQLVADGVLAPIHQAFSETLQRIDAGANQEVLLAAVLCSDQLSRGHVCLDLASASQISFPIPDADSRIRQYDNWPEESAWVEHLHDSPLVTVIEGASEPAPLTTPLVLDVEHRRLYLARYWYFEQRLASNIVTRLQKPALSLDEDRLQTEIAELFPSRKEAGSRDQCLAVARSVDRWFSVITGGPGTGKTTTVARLLALRLLLHLAEGHDPAELRILLMAPTGKAAQRLNESLDRATRHLDVDPQVLDALTQVSAGTIHRLLGWTPLPPERGGPFRRRADVPLEADIVLIDEASMVDLALMSRLFDAIPLSAQVILIGDRDQLASVEAGGVLSDLCGNLSRHSSDGSDARRQEVIARRTGLTDLERHAANSAIRKSAVDSKTWKKSSRRQKKGDPKQMTLSFNDTPAPEMSEPGAAPDTAPTASASDLAASIATLNYSHRFSAESGLGQLAAAIREGRADDVIGLLRDADPQQIRWLDADAASPASLDATINQAVASYRVYLEQLRNEPAGSLEILREASQVRVLCAHRSGLRGEVMLNERISEQLASEGLLSPYAGDSLGHLVMVSRNDYRLDLFNGDVGIVTRFDGQSSSSVAGRQGRSLIFEDNSEETGMRRVPAALIPGVQDCFAMTIHRSQGSEFGQVLIVLPEHDSPVLSRELLYTAVTRVKESRDSQNDQVTPGMLCISGSESVLRGAVVRSIQRISGLADRIDRQPARHC